MRVGIGSGRAKLAAAQPKLMRLLPLAEVGTQRRAEISSRRVGCHRSTSPDLRTRYQCNKPGAGALLRSEGDSGWVISKRDRVISPWNRRGASRSVYGGGAAQIQAACERLSPEASGGGRVLMRANSLLQPPDVSGWMSPPQNEPLIFPPARNSWRKGLARVSRARWC